MQKFPADKAPVVYTRNYTIDNCVWFKDRFYWFEDIPGTWIPGGTVNGVYQNGRRNPRDFPLLVKDSEGNRHAIKELDAGYIPQFMEDKDGKLAVSFYFAGAVTLDGKLTCSKAGDPPRFISYRNPTSWNDEDRVWEYHLKEYYLPFSNGDEKRRSFNDTHVVLTGNDAAKHCPMLMGPTRATQFLTKNVKQKHLVIYPRDGEPRLMKLDGRDNPIAVLIAGHGQTFAAVCNSAVYIIDLD